MKSNVNYIPEGCRSVTPYLVVRGASDAIAYYKKAFGAVESSRFEGPDGKIMHAEIRIGDSLVMLGDENLSMGARSPQTLNGTATSIFLYIPDVDAVFETAVSAGATPIMPPMDMFWGDRYGKLTDPFGHEWGLATHIEDVSSEEMKVRAASMFAAAAQAKG